MATSSPDRTRAPQLEPPALGRLAFGSLLLAALTQAAGLALLDWQHRPPGSTLLGVGSVYFVFFGSVVWFCAMSAGMVPAVLAQGSIAFRTSLVGLHLLVNWTVATGIYYYLSGGSHHPPESVARITSLFILLMTWKTAGLVGGVLLASALFGWVLARDPADAQRRTFSVRGMLVATAVIALLFASPQFAPPIGEALVHALGLGRQLTSNQTIRTTADPTALAPLLIAGVTGAALTISLLAGMGCLRGRPGLRVLGAICLVFGVLAGVPMAIVEASIAMPSTIIALASALFIGSSLTAGHATLWERAGWQQVRIKFGGTRPIPQYTLSFGESRRQ